MCIYNVTHGRCTNFSLLIDEGMQKKQQIEYCCEICLKNLVTIKLYELHGAHAGCR